MPKFLCSYAHDIACYADFIVEAKNERAAIRQIRQALRDGKFENVDATPCWENGPSNERVFVQGPATTFDPETTLAELTGRSHLFSPHTGQCVRCGQSSEDDAPANTLVRSQTSTEWNNQMSHFTTIQTQIKDIEALRSTCTELGLPLLQNAEARGFSQQTRHGDYVIKLNGPYDIAVNQQDGTYGLTTDWWNGHVEKEVGHGFGKLLQLYGVHKATLEARKKGLSVLRRNKADGAIKLLLMGA